MREGRNERHRTARSRRVRLWALLTGAIMLAAVVLTGCADFSAQDRDRAAGDFSANNDSPQKQQQTPTPEPSTPENQGPPPTGPCVDPDPQVIATCLASTGGLMPGDDQATTTVVAERTTGKLITAKRYGPQRAIASFDVDGSGDGGLVDFALSPTYSQDRLIYALITTPSDNRVVRIAPGDVAKPILTGIPKGATGNMGALYFRSPTELLVATGDAGDPSAAANPASLAGKLLSVTSFGSGANPPPKVVASGFGSNVALCHNDTGALYVADRTATEDRLQIVESAGPAEVEARIRLAVSRTSSEASDDEIAAGAVTIDEASYSARVNGTLLDGGVNVDQVDTSDGAKIVSNSYGADEFGRMRQYLARKGVLTHASTYEELLQLMQKHAQSAAATASAYVSWSDAKLRGFLKDRGVQVEALPSSRGELLRAMRAHYTPSWSVQWQQTFESALARVKRSGKSLLGVHDEL